jgi:hypothetical protein
MPYEEQLELLKERGLSMCGSGLKAKKVND